MQGGQLECQEVVKTSRMLIQNTKSTKLLAGGNILPGEGDDQEEPLCQAAPACRARQRPAEASHDMRPLVYNRLVCIDSTIKIHHTDPQRGDSAHRH